MMAVNTAETVAVGRGRRLPRYLIVLLSLSVIIYWSTGNWRPRTVPVAGNSMVPTLWGPSFRWNCTHCEFPLRREVQRHPEPTTCPNCGQQNRARSGRRMAADRVRVGLAESVDKLARWDLVALLRPNAEDFRRSERYLVKRVVGLPGEQVELRDGELFVDGQMVSKPWEVFQQLRIHVHDRLCQSVPAGSGPVKWISDHATSSWQFEHQLRFAAENTETLDRIYLVHTPAIPGLSTPPGKPLTGIVDYYPANQDLARPSLHQVRDLMIEADVSLSDGAEWLLELTTKDRVIAVRMNQQTGRVTLERNDDVLAESSLGKPAESARWQVSLAVFDNQLILKLGDQQLVAVEPADQSRRGPATVRMAARHGTVDVTALQLWRDVHWLGVDMTDKPWSLGRKLGKDEYLLLGDNPPVSEDSRQWQAGVSREKILGRVEKIH
jgi:type IV secretory pathway protease TraF